VSEYVIDLGTWNWSKLFGILPQRILDKIDRIHAPSKNSEEDKLAWKPSRDKCFSVKSAYNFITSTNLDNSRSMWGKI